MTRVNAIANRLSLRQPYAIRWKSWRGLRDRAGWQRGGTCQDSGNPQVGISHAGRLRARFPFAVLRVATGVGKTGSWGIHRISGEGRRHPAFHGAGANLTIYNKLIADSRRTREVRLPGLADFAINPPLIVTGDNYERGTAFAAAGCSRTIPFTSTFSISPRSTRKCAATRPADQAAFEYIGESYFDYWQARRPGAADGRVARYRASAGVRAINELKPILGLELTATPQIERGQKAGAVPQRHYSYPCRRRSRTVSSRNGRRHAGKLRADNYTKKAGAVKLTDAILIHEKPSAA